QRPLPKEAVQKSEREGKGSVSDSELEEMKKEAKQNLESDKAQQIEDDMRNIRKGRIEGDQYQFKSNESVVSQGTLADGARQHGEALPDEQGELHSLGRQLAMKLKRIKTEARAPTRRRMTGRLDSRAYSRGLAGDPKIYERKGRNIEMD